MEPRVFLPLASTFDANEKKFQLIQKRFTLQGNGRQVFFIARALLGQL